MDLGLHARFDTGDVVAHRVETGFGWVHLDHLSQLGLAALETPLPVVAQRLAKLHHDGLRVHPPVQDISVRIHCHVRPLPVQILRREV